MSVKRTIFFIAVLFLITFVYLVTVRRPASLSGPGFSFSRWSGSEKILRLERGESVRRLSLYDSVSQVEMVFEKRSARTWQMLKPVDYPAESLIVAGMVALLKTMPRNRSLSLNGGNASELGLDTPRFTICVVTNPHGRERCLDIGKETAVEGGAYGRWKNEEEYFLVNKNFFESFQKTVYTMRKKQVFALGDPSGVDSIRYRAGSSEFELKREKQKWVLLKPIRWAPGKDRVESLFSELNTLFVKEFLDGVKTDDPEFGFQGPKARALRVQLPDRSKQTIVVGLDAPGKDAYYAKLSEPAQVVLVAKGKMDHIDKIFETLSR